MTSRIDIVGSNGNDGLHYSEVGEDYIDKVRRATMSEYYRKGNIEVWDFIKDKELDYFEGNVVKYICRWRYKGGIEDLEKARDYLDKLIAIENSKKEPEPGRIYKVDPNTKIQNFFSNLDTD